MTGDNKRALKLLAAASLLGTGLAVTPVYAADSPAAVPGTGSSMQMTPADQAKWAKKTKGQAKWQKSKAKWSPPDKKPVP